MEASDPKHSLFFLLYLFSFCFLCFMAKVEGLNKNISALYVFGDSTVDPGNNNLIDTLVRSNFQPYGRDFAKQAPTGRFTNGKLVTDFIASYIGLKEFLPPYLDPDLENHELITGVSFASAGSGFDPLTPTLTNVIPMTKQLEYFKECKESLKGVLGKERAENHIKNALFVVSAGANDYVVNYFTVPMRRRKYTLSSYRHFLIYHIEVFIQNLWAEGAREIALVGLPPLGCLPIMITFNSNDAVLQRGCIKKYSSVAEHFNSLLRTHLMQMNSSIPGLKVHYIDSYGPLDEMIHRHENYGFEKVDIGCCGTGYVETSILCNPTSRVCDDLSKYVFWDAIHPTERAYYNLFKAVCPILDSIIEH